MLDIFGHTKSNLNEITKTAAAARRVGFQIFLVKIASSPFIHK
jgi:hypothetical protein